MTKLISRALFGASAIALGTLTASPAAAQNIDRIVAFGDSLADSGNALFFLLNSPLVDPALKAQLAALYPTGRFSGGTNYIDTLALILDVPTLNYAVGGAQTGPSNQFTGLPGFAVETGVFLSGASPPPERSFRPTAASRKATCWLCRSASTMRAHSIRPTLAGRLPRRRPPRRSPSPRPPPASTCSSPPARRPSAMSRSMPD
jgi:hypothetical protein